MSREPIKNFLEEKFLMGTRQADFIITYNRKDLQPAEKFGIKVVTPLEFLQQVGEIS